MDNINITHWFLKRLKECGNNYYDDYINMLLNYPTYQDYLKSESFYNKDDMLYGFLFYGLIIVENDNLRCYVFEDEPDKYFFPLIFYTLIHDDFIFYNRSFIEDHLETYDDYKQMKQYVKDKLIEDSKKIF
jgi:hypothetical protein